MKRKTSQLWLVFPLFAIAVAVIYPRAAVLPGDGPASASQLGDAFLKRVQPLLKKYCFECHSTKKHKGDLDLERFESLAAIRKDLRPWQHLLERVEVGEMPP